MARSKNVSGEDAPRALSKAKDWFDLYIYIYIYMYSAPKKDRNVVYICDLYM